MRKHLIAAALAWRLTDNGLATLPRLRAPLPRRGVVERKPRNRVEERRRRWVRLMNALGLAA